MNHNLVTVDMMQSEIRSAVAAAESRAAQLEADNDDMQSYINEIRVALHTEKDELTIDAVRRVISERDELRAKLAEIKSILAGGRTVGGDAEQAYRDAEEIAEDGANAHKAMIQ